MAQPVDFLFYVIQRAVEQDGQLSQEYLDVAFATWRSMHADHEWKDRWDVQYHQACEAAETANTNKEAFLQGLVDLSPEGKGYINKCHGSNA